MFQDGKEEYDACWIKQLNFSELKESILKHSFNINNDYKLVSSNETFVRCSQWEYDDSFGRSTIISEVRAGFNKAPALLLPLQHAYITATRIVVLTYSRRCVASIAIVVGKYTDKSWCDLQAEHLFLKS